MIKQIGLIMSDSCGRKIYCIRDLRYTLPQLLLTSAIMILSGMAVSIFAFVVMNVKPIMLDRCGASATQIALITGTLPQIINFFLCPVISTCSDKTRTRFGRRKPYLILTAPLVTLILVLIGFNGEIARFFCGIFPGKDPGMISFVLVSTLLVLFQFIFLFPGSVVWYLIADVIPRECFGRYQAISSVVNTIVSSGLNFFVLDHAVNNMKPTFCIIGAGYLLIYVLQFFLVNEGTYEPVADKIRSGGSWFRKSVDYVQLFFKQGFSCKIFLFLFLCMGLNQASNICRGMFNVLFATKEIGMSVAEYGKVMGWSMVISAAAIFYVGKLMDKYHPIMVYMISGFFIMAVNIFGYFLVYTPMTFTVIGIATALMYAVQNLAQTPLLVAILPMNKFGQLASVNSMVNSVVVFAAAYLGGYLTDYFGYRLMFIWDLAVTAMATAALFVVYDQWKKAGGKAGYTPPQLD